MFGPWGPGVPAAWGCEVALQRKPGVVLKKTAAGGAKKVAKKILNTAKLELVIWRPLHDNDRLYAVRFGNLKA